MEKSVVFQLASDSHGTTLLPKPGPETATPREHKPSRASKPSGLCEANSSEDDCFQGFQRKRALVGTPSKTFMGAANSQLGVYPQHPAQQALPIKKRPHLPEKKRALPPGEAAAGGRLLFRSGSAHGAPAVLARFPAQ